MLKVTGVNITVPDADSTFGPSRPLVVHAALTTSASVPLPQQISVSTPAFNNGLSMLTLQGVEYVGDAGLPTTTTTGPSTVTVTAMLDDAGFTDSRSILIDKTPPVVLLTVMPAPTRVQDGGLSNFDDILPYSYKRDEVAELRIISTKPVDYAASEIVIADGGGIANEVACSTTCAPDGGSCECFVVALSLLPMNSLRQSYFSTIPAKVDSVGNLSNSPPSAQFDVTRLNWKRDLRVSSSTPAAIHTPAITSQGVLYVGVEQDTQTGRLWALNPDGTLVNGFDGGTAAVTSHAVVNHSLFWPTKDASNVGALNALSLNSGSTRSGQCPDTARIFNSALAVAGLDAGGDERFVGISSNGWIVLFRPGAAGNVCVEASVAPGKYSIAVSSEVTSGALNDKSGVVFMANKSSTLSRVPWSDPALSSPSWGSATSTTWHTLETEALAKNGSIIAGGGGGLDVGGLYSYPDGFAAGASGQKVTIGSSADGGYASATGPAIDVESSGQLFVYGNGPKLVQVGFDGGTFGTPQSVVLGNTQLVGVPAIGRDSTRYVVSNGGQLFAVAPDLSVLWSGLLTTNGTDFVQDSLALDASRPATGGGAGCNPGHVYVAAKGDGNIYSIIVDSKGLKSNAPWPTFQHDNARTANESRALADWSCP